MIDEETYELHTEPENPEQTEWSQDTIDFIFQESESENFYKDEFDEVERQEYYDVEKEPQEEGETERFLGEYRIEIIDRLLNEMD